MAVHHDDELLMMADDGWWLVAAVAAAAAAAAACIKIEIPINPRNSNKMTVSFFTGAVFFFSAFFLLLVVLCCCTPCRSLLTGCCVCGGKSTKAKTSSQKQQRTATHTATHTASSAAPTRRSTVQGQVWSNHFGRRRPPASFLLFKHKRPSILWSTISREVMSQFQFYFFS